MQGMRSDASFKKISFPLDKPLVGDSSLARHVAKFNQKKPKKKTTTNEKSCFVFGVFLLGVPDTAERCTLGTAKKPKKFDKKMRIYSIFLGIHPPHERPCGTKKEKKHNKPLFLQFPRHWKKKEKNMYIWFLCAAVPNHRSWSPRSDVAGFMDVMQTKGSRQISRVPSEDAVAPTSGFLAQNRSKKEEKLSVWVFICRYRSDWNCYACAGESDCLIET